MNSVERFAKQLMRTSGHERSLAIAKRSLVALAVEDLPVGEIFYRELDHRSKLTAEEQKTVRNIKTKRYYLDLDRLRSLRGFWQQVQGIIKRELSVSR